MIKSLALLIFATQSYISFNPKTWPGNMIFSFKGKGLTSQPIKIITPPPTGSAEQHQVHNQVIPKGITHGSVYIPIEVRLNVVDNGPIVKALYTLALKEQARGEVEKEASSLQRIVDQYPNYGLDYESTIDLADCDFRLGKYKQAYGMLSAYAVRYRDAGGSAIRLGNHDYLLVTSLALAKQGLVFPGQREFLLSIIQGRQNLYTADLPKTNSVRDITELSYLAMGSYWDEYYGIGVGVNYRGDGFWYYQQAYKEFGPSAYLDFQLALDSNDKVERKYIIDARARERKTGFLRHCIEGEWESYSKLLQLGYRPGTGNTSKAAGKK